MLDAQTTRFLAGLPYTAAADGDDVASLRAWHAAAMATNGIGPRMARVENVVAHGVHGDVALRVYRPTTYPPRGSIVFLHDGGFVAGSLDAADTIARKLAERSGCAVVGVGYRLAPDHPHPAALEDSWAALEWTVAHMADIAGERAPVILVGEGAGGCLAATVAALAADRGGPAIALQVLVCPATDADATRDSYRDLPHDALPYPLSAEAAIAAWRYRVPDASQRTDPLAAPLRRQDVSGLPPAVVLTAEHDPLRDEGDAYALRLAQAGVPVTHRCFDGQAHGFFSHLALYGSERAWQEVIGAARAVVVRAARTTHTTTSGRTR